LLQLSRGWYGTIIATYSIYLYRNYTLTMELLFAEDYNQMLKIHRGFQPDRSISMEIQEAFHVY